MSDTAVEKVSGKFYGVYLLCSESPEKKYKGKCYIGFTVNPNRRINQHNRGKDFGGARKTSDKGPWKMILIVYGFPNNIVALQFEWAWQSPAKSYRLKQFVELRKKGRKETLLQYNFRILSQMLLLGPWNRLSLTIRWLETNYKMEFEITKHPPLHMQIVSGKLAIDKKSSTQTDEFTCFWANECHLCMKAIDTPERSRIGCLNRKCKLTCHIICLANHCLTNNKNNRGHYIPVDGECPLCETHFTWAALLHSRSKRNGKTEENESSDDESEIDVKQQDSCNSESDDCQVLY